jgi:hypothetical protein
MLKRLRKNPLPIHKASHMNILPASPVLLIKLRPTVKENNNN